jgi:hypothetical protein
VDRADTIGSWCQGHDLLSRCIIGREGRVATGEDQAEAIVLHRPGLLSRRLVGGFARLACEFVPPRLASEVIDRAISSRRRDPAPGIRRQTVGRPFPQSEGEGLLDRILSEVDVAEDADQGGDRPTGLLPEDPADQRVIDDWQRQPPACPRRATPRSETR